MNTHAWHRVIDDVARDMTAADPAADFRARVMEQVSTTPPARRLAAFTWTWRGATLAAAVVIAAIAVSVTQPLRNSEPSRSMARAGTPSPPVVAPADPAPNVEAPGPASAPRRASAPQPSAALVEWRARNIPALADVAALEMDHIQPAGLSISQLSVRPLGIAPIVVPSIPQIDDQR